MKYASGLIPVNFKLAGKVLLILGAAGVLLRGVAYLTGWFVISSNIFFISLAILAVGVYLIFVVPKE